MRAVWVGLVWAGMGASGWGQATVTYHQDRPQLEVQHFTIAVGEDGSGSYHAELAAAKAGDAGAVVDRPIALGSGTTKKIFELARAADRFDRVCQSKAKNVADTGAKTLTYVGADGKGECRFNYTEVKPVAELTDLFLGIETTLEIGRRLDFLRRFDRLGLDAEIISLGTLVAEHRAWGVEAIGGTLRSIANDTELLQRVRLRAAKIIEQGDSARE